MATNHLLVDGIVACVFGPQKTDIITYSDLARPGIDGTPRTLDKLVVRALKDQEAQRYGMQSSPEAVEKNLQAVFREHNWAENDFNKMVQAAGWMPEEAREEFRIMTDVNQIESFKIFSQLIVPERDILAYYQANLELEPASYHIQRAVVPYDFEIEREIQLKEILKSLKKQKLELEWSPSFWVTEDDIKNDKEFIASLDIHQISQPREVVEGFEFFKLLESKERHQKTLEEMRNKIIEILRAPKAEELQESYHKDLLKRSTVVYCDPNIQPLSTDERSGDDIQ